MQRKIEGLQIGAKLIGTAKTYLCFFPTRTDRSVEKKSVTMHQLAISAVVFTCLIALVYAQLNVYTFYNRLGCTDEVKHAGIYTTLFAQASGFEYCPGSSTCVNSSTSSPVPHSYRCEPNMPMVLPTITTYDKIPVGDYWARFSFQNLNCEPPSHNVEFYPFKLDQCLFTSTLQSVTYYKYVIDGATISHLTYTDAQCTTRSSAPPSVIVDNLGMCKDFSMMNGTIVGSNWNQHVRGTQTSSASAYFPLIVLLVCGLFFIFL